MRVTIRHYDWRTPGKALEKHTRKLLQGLTAGVHDFKLVLPTLLDECTAVHFRGFLQSINPHMANSGQKNSYIFRTDVNVRSIIIEFDLCLSAADRYCICTGYSPSKIPFVEPKVRVLRFQF